MPRLSLLLIPIALGCGPKALPIPGPLGSLGTDPVEVGPVPDAATPETPVETPLAAPSPGHGPRIAQAAEHYLAHRPRGFRDDCSGFVSAALTRADVPVLLNTTGLWERARELGATHKRTHPEVGDLAFFDQTYDRNGNGKLDDPLTHVAVVLRVEDDGTIVMAHGGTSRGRTILTMNLQQPDVRADDHGNVLNDYLRARRSGDRPGTRYLAGELWRGFATIRPTDLDAWAGVGP